MKTLFTKASALIAIVLLFSATGNFVSAQLNHFCGTDEIMQNLLNTNPDVVKAQQELDAFTKDFIQNHKPETNERGGPTYIIPIVFHIIHDYGVENISDAVVDTAVYILNRDYQKRNADTSQVYQSFKPLIADCNIEFRLAQIDPDGNCTNGIDRVFSYRTYQGDDRGKLGTVWDRRNYLNIWVVNRIADGNVAAYAYLPAGASGLGYKVDGVIARYNYVGADPVNGRTLTHEIGHSFNLSHPWGGGTVATACGDDGVDDTPVTEGGTNCPSNLVDFTCDKDTIRKTWQFNSVTTLSGSIAAPMYDPASDSSVTLMASAHGVAANSSLDSVFAFAGWDTGAVDGVDSFYSHTGTLNPSKYYEFTVQPKFGQGMSFTGVRFHVKRSAMGPRMFSVRSSETANFGSNLVASLISPNANLSVQTDTNPNPDQQYIFYFSNDTSVWVNEGKTTVSAPQYNNTDDTVTFRIYAWNAEDTLGTFEIDSVAIIGFYGTVENLDNYMDYTYCHRMFTIGQMERMHATLNNSISSRNNLWTPANLALTGVDNPQPCAPEADFYTLKNMECQNGPNTVQFFNNSARGTPTSWLWSFPGGTPSTSTLQNPTVTFNTLYSQSVTLTVTNAQGSSSVTKDNVWVSPNWADYVGLFSEDFEDPSRFNTLWRVDNRFNNVSSWHVTNTGTFPSGNHGLKINAFSPMVLSTNTTPIVILDWGIGGFDKDAFVTPSFDLTHIINNGTAKLEFKLSGATRATDPLDITDKLQVYYSTTCGNTWSTFPSSAGIYTGSTLSNAGSWQGDYVPATGTQWVQKSINLPVAALNAKVRFKFEYISGDFSNNIYIDDVNISGSVGIEDNNPGALADLVVFPNPASNEVSVTYRLPSSKNIKLEIYDAIGNLVYDLVNQKQSAGSYTITFNTSSIANGIYQVKLIGDNVNLKTEKIVVIK